MALSRLAYSVSFSLLFFLITVNAFLCISSNRFIFSSSSSSLCTIHGVRSTISPISTVSHHHKSPAITFVTSPNRGVQGQPSSVKRILNLCISLWRVAAQSPRKNTPSTAPAHEKNQRRRRQTLEPHRPPNGGNHRLTRHQD